MLESQILFVLTQNIFFCFYLGRILYPLFKKIEFYPVIGQQPLTLGQRFDLAFNNFLYYVQYRLFDNFFSCVLVQSGVLFFISWFCRAGGVCCLTSLITCIEAEPLVVLQDHQFMETYTALDSEKPEFFQKIKTSSGRRAIALLTAMDKNFSGSIYVPRALVEQSLQKQTDVVRTEFVGDGSQMCRVFYLCHQEDLKNSGVPAGKVLAQESKLAMAITDNMKKPHYGYFIQSKYNNKEDFVTREMFVLTSTGVPEGTQPYAEALAKHTKDQYVGAGKVRFDGVQPLPEGKSTSIHATSKVFEVTPALRAKMQQSIWNQVATLQQDLDFLVRHKNPALRQQALFDLIVENKTLLDLFCISPKTFGGVHSLAALERVALEIKQLDVSFCYDRVFSVLTEIPKLICSDTKSATQLQVAMQTVKHKPSSSYIQDWNSPHNKNFAREIYPEALRVNSIFNNLAYPGNLQYILKTVGSKMIR